jgi:hypothetical protein
LLGCCCLLLAGLLLLVACWTAESSVVEQICHSQEHG